jgi:hypothetical protein
MQDRSRSGRMFPTLEKQRLRLREIISEGAQDIFNCFFNNEAVRFKEQTEPASQKIVLLETLLLTCKCSLPSSFATK